MVSPPVRVCFVCSGNICRSPTAEVVLRRLADDAGRAGSLSIDSAGTGGWHAGDDMDPRARRTMVHAGYDVAPHCARQFEATDFAERDLVVALDAGHHHALWWLATQTDDVDAARAKIVLLRSFDPQWHEGEDRDVPDPYYGGADGFKDVLAMIERGSAGLLQAIEDAIDDGRPMTDVASGLQQTGKPPL